MAAGLKSQVNNADKEKRAHIMAEAIRKSETEFLKQLCGKIRPVLFETGENGFFEGYTANYSRVVVKVEKNLTGQIYNVLIKSVKDDYCIGELL